MGPPGLGVIPAPRVSQGQRRLPGGDTSHPSPHILSSLLISSQYLLHPPTETHWQPTTAASAYNWTSDTSAAMEMSYCSPLELQDNSMFFDYDLLLEKSPACDPSSDPGYVSAGSSLSPTSSVDSFCFSPASLQALRNEQDALNCFLLSSTVGPQPSQQKENLSSRHSSSFIASVKKYRSRYPSKKRQTASEREKLRMRDLTKAMHQLRTFLPPSVVPAGQALTKIETLRLTIQYISYLSEQLGLSQEVLEQRRSSGFVEQVQTFSQFLDQPTAVNTEQMSSLQHSYQGLSEGYFTSEMSWKHHEQSELFPFTGQY